MLNVVALFGPSADVNVNACCRLTLLQVPGNLLLKLTSEVQLCSRIHSPEKCRAVTVSLQHQRGSILLNSPWSRQHFVTVIIMTEIRGTGAPWSCWHFLLVNQCVPFTSPRSLCFNHYLLLSWHYYLLLHWMCPLFQSRWSPNDAHIFQGGGLATKSLLDHKRRPPVGFLHWIPRHLYSKGSI